MKELKSEAPGWIGFGFGFIGYTMLMFFLLSERTNGIHYFENLALFNKNIMYLMSFLLVTMSIGKKRLFTDEKENSPLWIDVYVAPFIFFLIGILFPAMFFVLITK
ncbi:hypothetical protein [Acinetobacter johnsonii]|uniref:hypothetical protein n=1 Tax=Acinetobacter johnsonii TaxID=40214 RepID=UPI00244CFC4D|nr:hypothetical protein [Acinetobacter johnsonii]MDH1801704.1 hypothetical protein [Acinetobacter johnsonii]